MSLRFLRPIRIDPWGGFTSIDRAKCQREYAAETFVETYYDRFCRSGKTLVPRKPPSLVQKCGIQWGRSPLGREEGSRGTFMEWFPGRVFAFFRRAAKEGRSRRSETFLVLFPSFVPRRSGQSSASLRIRRSPVLFVSLSRRLRRPTFSTWRK